MIKEKKEKENVLIDLELVNLKNASMSNSKNFLRNNKSKKIKIGGGKGILEESSVAVSIVEDCKKVEEEFGPS